MPILKNELNKWLLRTFQFESGDYREMLRARIEDLADRNIEDSMMEVYLRTSGWNPEIANVYREFKSYLKQQEKQEVSMSDEMITKTQAKQALRQMLRELAQAAGYDFDDSEELSAIRTNFATYLRALQATADLDISGIESGDTIDAGSAALALSYLKEAEKTLNDALTAR